ncbi:MAG: hypothetical protein NDJ19_00305 [Ramlibacter sp.]|nr:hypothetical protein [Ramlibacter sp.]
MKTNRLLLTLLLAASAAAALWLPPTTSEVVAPVARPGQGGRTAAGAAPREKPAVSGRLDRLVPRTASDEGTAGPFAVPTWVARKVAAVPVQAVSASVAEPAPPQAPLAPFKVIGRYEEGGRAGVFLEHQQRTIVARGGEQLTPEWKVDSVEGGRVVIEYLPLSQRQTLELTSSAAGKVTE